MFAIDKTTHHYEIWYKNEILGHAEIGEEFVFVERLGLANDTNVYYNLIMKKEDNNVQN